jgi:hypothetical protein
MARKCRAVLLLALAAVAVHQLAVVAAAEEANPLEQPKFSVGRKLLQPFTLALQPITRVTSNAGRVTEKRIIANNNDVVAPQVSSGSLIDRESLLVKQTCWVLSQETDSRVAVLDSSLLCCAMPVLRHYSAFCFAA